MTDACTQTSTNYGHRVLVAGEVAVQQTELVPDHGMLNLKYLIYTNQEAKTQ
jgi:hypothetical protein